jgi:hypothetical protein
MSFVIVKHIPNIYCMLTNYVLCASGYVSLYNMFNEYVKHCDGFQTLTKDTFKAKMISLKFEYSNNGRGPDNTIGCFKSIRSTSDYNHRLESMNDSISELGDDIMQCFTVEYDRRHSKRQYELESFVHFQANNGQPLVG